MKDKLTEDKIRQILKKEIPCLRRDYDVEKIAIFGSFIKGKSKKKSDVDILVKLKKPLGLDFIDLAFHLEKVLGRKVDLVTFDTLERSMKNPRYKHIASDIRRTLSYV